LHGHDQVAITQYGYGVPHSAAGHAVGMDQRRLARELAVWLLQIAGIDLPLEDVGELPVGRHSRATSSGPSTASASRTFYGQLPYIICATPPQRC
jgi:hypothetical protein